MLHGTTTIRALPGAVRLLRVLAQREDFGASVVTGNFEATAEILGLHPDQARDVELARGEGCDYCFNTGYSGRTGVFEILTMDSELRSSILHGGSHDELIQIARSKGMETLDESARKKVLSGQTSVEEMHRVLTSF